MKKKIPHRGMTAIAFPLAIAGLLSLYSCKKHTTPSPENENTGPAIHVEATAGFGNGVNLQPSYYNGGNPNFGWSLMKQQSKIKTVRIEIEPGYVTQAKSWISQARSNGYAVIATYHKASVLGSDNTAELNAAAN